MPLASNGHSDGAAYARNPRPRNKFVGLSQAYELRELAFQEANSIAKTEPKTFDERIARARALQSLGALWTDACDRIRIMRGRPLPGSLRPERKPSKKRSRASGPVAPAIEQPQPGPVTDPPAV